MGEMKPKRSQQLQDIADFFERLESPGLYGRKPRRKKSRTRYGRSYKKAFHFHRR